MITDQLKSELASIREKLTQLEPLKRREALIVDLLASYGESHEQRELLTVATGVNPSRYANLSLRDAVVAVLVSLPGKFRTPREITREMLTGGFKTDSPNLRTMVGATCKRKSEGENAEFETRTIGGAVCYRLKSSTPPQ